MHAADELVRVLADALARQQRRDLEGAAELLGHAVARWPESADAHHLLGVNAYLRGDLSAARAHIERASAMDPTVWAYRVNLGNVALAGGELELAQAQYETALAAAPDEAGVLCNLASVFARRGELPQAAATYERAITLQPEASAAWQGAAWARAAHGDFACLPALYRAWHRACPIDPVARWLAAAQDIAIPAPDPGFVETYFDRFAPDYDAVLDGLHEQAGDALAGALAELLPRPCATLAVLDAGCGTGRMGARLRPWARHLAGIDISAAMLELAVRRGVYDEIVRGELVQALRERRCAYDLIVACDVLVYFGDLTAPLSAMAEALRPGGHLALSIERGESDVALRATGRFAHGEEHLRTRLREHGLDVAHWQTIEIRREAGTSVTGTLVITGAPDRERDA